ncbi:MAG: hypothetical protein R3E87_26685 [Burkholderiaceae bacterium]
MAAAKTIEAVRHVVGVDQAGDADHRERNGEQAQADVEWRETLTQLMYDGAADEGDRECRRELRREAVTGAYRTNIVEGADHQHERNRRDQALCMNGPRTIERQHQEQARRERGTTDQRDLAFVLLAGGGPVDPVNHMGQWHQRSGDGPAKQGR